MSRLRLAEALSALNAAMIPGKSPSAHSQFSLALRKSQSERGTSSLPFPTSFTPWTPCFFHPFLYGPWLKSNKHTGLCLPLSLLHWGHPSQISFSITCPSDPSSCPLNPTLRCSCSLVHTPATVDRNSSRNHLTQQTGYVDVSLKENVMQQIWQFWYTRTQKWAKHKKILNQK